MSADQILIRIANKNDACFVQAIVDEIEKASKVPGTGICKRSPSLIYRKMLEGDAVIAVTEKGAWVGFCYIHSWEDGAYVSSCALVTAQDRRSKGIAGNIKQRILQLAKRKYPGAKIFGMTTSLAVMKINSQLGYEPVTYSEITKDASFWESCKTCDNYEVLKQKDKKNCFCTAMLFTVDEMEKIERSFSKERNRKVVHSSMI